jgi:putative ABC transport system permease protein
VNVQAFMLCLIGIPLRLFLGYFLAVVMFPLLLVQTILNGSFTLSALHPIVFAFAALLSLITVFISCNHPARIAAKISPVEATRYTDVTPGPNKVVKNGYNGAKVEHMAFKIFQKQKKTTITLASVSFGLILFNIVFTFTNSFDVNKSLKQYIHGDFVIASDTYLNITSPYLTPAHKLTHETLEAVSKLDGVIRVAEIYFERTEETQIGFEMPI